MLLINRLLANKKIAITVLVLVIVLSVGIVILVTSESKKAKDNNADIKTEQSKEHGKEDTDSQNNEGGLEVLEPDEIAPENSSDASGSWKTPSNSGNKKDDTSEKNENQDKDNGSNEPEEEKDILKDDITWGDVY